MCDNTKKIIGVFCFTFRSLFTFIISILRVYTISCGVKYFFLIVWTTRLKGTPTIHTVYRYFLIKYHSNQMPPYRLAYWLCGYVFHILYKKKTKKIRILVFLVLHYAHRKRTSRRRMIIKTELNTTRCSVDPFLGLSTLICQYVMLWMNNRFDFCWLLETNCFVRRVSIIRNLNN